jgi:RNA polymerase-binding protein DksA
MSKELKKKKKAAASTAGAKKSVKKAPAKKAAPAKKTPAAKKAPVKKAAPAKKTPAVKKAPVKKAAPAKKTPAVKKAPAKKAAPAKKKVVAKKAPAKKAAPAKKKAVSKKAPAKKPAVKKAPVKKTAPVKKKAAARKAAPAKKGPTTIRKSTFNKKITKLLLNARNKILQEVSEKVRSESEEPKEMLGDIYDIASNERERELSLILGDRDRGKLAEIEDAFDRLKLDCYEECEECGEPIAQKRLLAMPFTRVCVECKSKHERRQKATGRYEEEAPVGAGILERSGADDDDF